MKKIFSVLAMAVAALSASATDYTTTIESNGGYGASKYDNSVVTVDDNGDGTCKVTIKNVVYKMYAIDKYFGTIVLDNVKLTQAGVYQLLNTVQQVNVQAGDENRDWQGPTVSDNIPGGIPVYFAGEIRKGKLFANVIVDTYYATNRTMKLTIGDGSYVIGQIPNSDFESFHECSFGNAQSLEPDTWHSFMTATGSWVSAVAGTPHTAESTDVRPGTTGKKSVLINSSKVLGSIIANGTITTGQMFAGATSATNPDNNATLDFANENIDPIGDPFYVTLDGQPDAISMWLKFVQGTPNASYPYATMSSVITDGTRYQDPEKPGVEQTNVVAKAQNPQIESCNGEWQNIVKSFDYDSWTANNAAANAILVTISTNATPGKGSANDLLNVDDVELIYNNSATSIKYNGNEIPGFQSDKFYGYDAIEATSKVSLDDIAVTVDGRGAKVMKFIRRNKADNGMVKATAYITVVSADYKNLNRYSIVFNEQDTDGISSAEIKQDCDVRPEKIYSLSGQRVADMQPGTVYVVKTAAGKTVKVMKK